MNVTRQRLARSAMLALMVFSGAGTGTPAHGAEAAAGRQDRHGDVLPAGALQRFGTSRFRNGAGIFTIKYSLDGKLIASAGGTPWAQQNVASGDRTIRLWEVETGREVRQLTEHPAGVSWLAFSPDRKTLAASTTADGSIRFWDLGTPKAPRVVQVANQGGLPMTCAFAPDGKTLAVTRGVPAEIGLLDVESGKELRAFGKSTLAIESLAYSPDGKFLAAKAGASVRLWEVATGRLARLFRPQAYHSKVKLLSLGPQGVQLFATAPTVFSPDGKVLAFEAGDNTVHLFDVESGKELRRLVHQGAIASASFSPDSKRLVTGSHDNAIRVWDVATGTALHHVEDHFGGYSITAFAPDGKSFASAGGDHTIRFWEPAAGKELRPQEAHRGELLTGAYHPDGKTFVSVGRDNFVRTWDVASGRELRRFADDRDTFDVVTISPDGKVLATYSNDSETTRLWDLGDGKLLRELAGILDGMAFRPDGKVLFTANEDQLTAWDVKTGEASRPFGDVTATNGLFAFSADGKTAVLMNKMLVPEAWDLATAKKLRDLENVIENQNVIKFAVSPDGSTAGALMPGGLVQLWDVASGRALHRLEKAGGPAFTNAVGTIAFSPDGRSIAGTGGGNSAAVVWDVATGKERASFAGHRGPLTFVAFAPDGRLLASGSWDTTVLQWDVYGLFDKAPEKPEPAPDLEAAWTDLGNREDGIKMQRALRTLVVNPRQAVPLLDRHLKPQAAVTREHVARLLKDLDGNQFDVRQKAFDDLTALGFLAENQLRQSLAQELSVEVRRRVEQLLESLRENATTVDLQPRRGLEVLELIGTPEARAVIEKLVAGAPTSLVTRDARRSLERLRARNSGQR